MRVRPFRGVRFTGGHPLRSVLCPPYDVIPPALARRLRRNPRNAVHLELPAGGGDRYARARRLWRKWLRSGVLERDPRPSFYIVEEGFRTEKGFRRRTGVLAELGLDRRTASRVVAHERTLSGPKTDRTRLLRALRVNVSPIFGVCPDPRGKLRRMFAPARRSRPAAAGKALGVSYRFWRLDDPRRTAALERFFRRSRLLVADGHHRYEVARGFRSSDGILAYIVPEGDPGLRVHPTHRLVRPGPRLRGALRRSCRGKRMKGLAELTRALSRTRSPCAFGLFDGGFRLMLPAAEGVRSRFGTDWLSRRVLTGTDPARISYVHGAREAVRAARRTGRWALLVKPFTVSDVREAVARAGLLPQKSTYFHPKMNAGLVFRPAD